MATIDGLGRRDFLKASAAVVAGIASAASARPGRSSAASRLVAAPEAPEGTDMLPQIDHIVVAMMENHSYDNYLGMLGRGDGFRLDRDGRPKNACPGRQRQPDPRVPHAVAPASSMRSPSQAWNASHISLGKRRRNDGFVLAQRSGRHGLLRPRRTSPSTTGSRGRSRSAIASSPRASRRRTPTASS